MNAAAPAPPVSGTTAGEPVDVLAYLWSLRRYLPVGILVAAAVCAALILPGSGGTERSAVTVEGLLVVDIPKDAPPAATADAAAAASTYASLAQSPEALATIPVSGAETAELLRPRVEIYAIGASIVVKVNGLTLDDGTTVVNTLSERVIAQTQSVPITVGGEQATLTVAREAFELAGSAVTRSVIQSYILAAAAGGVAGLLVMAALGYRSRRRMR